MKMVNQIWLRISDAIRLKLNDNQNGLFTKVKVIQQSLQSYSLVSRY